MNDVHEVTVRLAVLTALRDTIDAEVAELRETAQEVLEFVGARSAVPTLPDGTEIATVALTKPKRRVDVDEDALLTWCKEEHPTEVIEAVRVSYRAALVKRLTVVALNEGDVVVDPETGEQMPWARPVPAGDPTLQVRFKPDGRGAVGDAWREGRLTLLGLDGAEPEPLPAVAESPPPGPPEDPLGGWVPEPAGPAESRTGPLDGWAVPGQEAMGDGW